jgi:hypothetical protein
MSPDADEYPAKEAGSIFGLYRTATANIEKSLGVCRPRTPTETLRTVSQRQNNAQALQYLDRQFGILERRRQSAAFPAGR